MLGCDGDGQEAMGEEPYPPLMAAISEIKARPPLENHPGAAYPGQSQSAVTAHIKIFIFISTYALESERWDIGLRTQTLRSQRRHKPEHDVQGPEETRWSQIPLDTMEQVFIPQCEGPAVSVLSTNHGNGLCHKRNYVSCLG
ncbi:hypothetical protein NDU88_004336 [Pleurodeles waltl]|uniref:Uncharacterized protein n=1 Tax=Pleurodeles waltl TaxID=8319 RepID=A0AAV7LJM3_PLEWA|nr:hypothetical protein NDU88_004336 [Pleurodeles waltl]